MADLATKNIQTRWPWSILAVVAFVGLIQGAWWLLGDQTAVYGGFVDGDSYTRLLRVERLIETRDWYDISIPDANAPYGTTVHWTRLFDMVLLLPSALMSPFIGFQKALFWAGTIISPILHLLTAATLTWALTPLMGRIAACFAGALSAAQIGVMVFGIVGRADHHMMFVLLIAVSLGFLIRVMVRQESPIGFSWTAGLSIASGVWVGPEFLLYMALCFTVLGLQWVFEPALGKFRSALHVSAGFASGLILTVLIDRGFSGFVIVEYDRISIVHITLGLSILAFWLGISFYKQQLSNMRFLTRASLSISGVMIIAVIMVYLFPGIISNPLNDADPAIQPIYAHISEYKPITDMGRLLIYYGSGLFAVPWLFWRLKYTIGTVEFWPWVLVGICLLVYMILGINWIRWCLYAGLFFSILIADAVFHLDQYISRNFSFPKRLFYKIVSVLLITTGPMIVGAVLLYSGKTPDQRMAEKQIACPVIELSEVLNREPFNKQSQIIAASANFGPELIYRTDHKAVATVHHRNVSGILDGHKIFQATDDAVARNIVDTRGVSLFLLCPNSADDKYFLTGSKPGALYARLIKNQIPDWLSPVRLPKNLQNKFKLFEVRQGL